MKRYKIHNDYKKLPFFYQPVDGIYFKNSIYCRCLQKIHFWKYMLFLLIVNTENTIKFGRQALFLTNLNNFLY